MTNKFLHEAEFRGVESLARLARPTIVMCGAGALGSHLVDNLARQGFENFRAIDCDRVEEHNVNTQLYGVGDVGAWKVEVLRNRLFRSVEIEIEAVSKELTERNARSMLRGADIVVDAFDNSKSRSLVQDTVRETAVPCLHVGLFADYCEVIWDENYRVPADAAGDVCEYPLARNLVLLAVAIASESLVRFVLDDEKFDRSATLSDFAVQVLEPRR